MGDINIKYNCMKKSAVIITKPLQYINASNIINDKSRDLYIVSWFVNYQWFADIIARYDPVWNSVYVFASRNQALKYILKHKREYSDVFIDTDFGVGINLLFLLLWPITINVYEEGWATYYYINPKLSAMKKWKWLLSRFFFHFNNYIGGSLFTKNIYVYNLQMYYSNINNTRQKILPFQNSFCEHILKMEHLCDVYSGRMNFSQLNNADVILFLGSWPETHYDYFTSIQERYKGYKSIIKYHPHYVQNENEKDFSVEIVIDSDIPAEFVVIQLLKIVNKLVVVHEHTSALMYIKSHKIVDIDYYGVHFSK